MFVVAADGYYGDTRFFLYFITLDDDTQSCAFISEAKCPIHDCPPLRI